MRRTTHLLDGVNEVKLTGRVYLRAIVPIGFFFSLSLICSNQAYLYLSVAFIQMLKATTPVAVLIASWALAIEERDLKKLGTVSFIVLGVMISSYGEIEFRMIGFIFQAFGITFEAIRLVLVQRLLSSAEYKMGPLVSLYYFAPVCALMNGIICIIVEGPQLSLKAVSDVGYLVFLLNATVALCLNISVVFLIGKTSSLVLTLSGVLKDILLVAASILIFGSPIVGLQMFGYSIALGGLVYYKLGFEGIKQGYEKLAGGQTGLPKSTADLRALPVWKKIAGILAVVGVVLTIGASMHPTSQGYLHSSTDRITESLPNLPNMPSLPSSPFKMGKRDLDLVFTMSSEQLSALSTKFELIRSSPVIASRKPKTIIYLTNANVNAQDVKRVLGVDSVIALSSDIPEESVYLNHIINEYDNLAKHTIFAHAGFRETEQVIKRISTGLTDRTGVMDLGTRYASCDCNNCTDPWTDSEVWRQIPQLYSMANKAVCPDTGLLLSYSNQFLASQKRIQTTDLSVWKSLQTTLMVSAPSFLKNDANFQGR